MSASRGLARSAAWNVSASGASVASAIGVTAVAYRNVSDSTLGTYFTVLAGQAMLALLEPVIAYATSRSTARSLAAGKDRTLAVADVRIMLNGLASTAVLVLTATSVGVLVWKHVGSPIPGLAFAVWLLSVTLGAQLLTATLPAIATGSGNFRINAIATIAGAAANVLAVLLLVPRVGVAGLAWGLLVGVAVGRIVLLHWRQTRATWVPLVPTRVSAASATRLWRDAGGLLLISAAGQVVTWADLVVISAVRDSAVTAQYRLGVLVPTQAVALLFRAYDVIYPYLASGEPVIQIRATRLLTRVFGAVSGAVLGALVVMRADLLELLGGSAAEHAASAPFLLFALMWAANVPAHGLALLLIARERQSVLLPIVLSEAGANVALTLCLTPLYGATGAAAASLITLAACNLVALPLVVRGGDVPGPRLVLLEGLLPVTTLLALTAGLLTPLAAITDGALRWGVVAVGGVAIAVAGATIFGGRDGRQAIRQSVLR